jgi:hypothetical protein
MRVATASRATASFLSVMMSAMLVACGRLLGSRPTAAQYSSRIASFLANTLPAAPDVPVIGVPGHDPERDALPAAADEQVGRRRPHRLRIAGVADDQRYGILVIPLV